MPFGALVQTDGVMCHMSGHLLRESSRIMTPLYRLARLDGPLELGPMAPEMGISDDTVLLPILRDRELLAVADDLPALGRLAAAGAAPSRSFDSGQHICLVTGSSTEASDHLSLPFLGT